MAKRVCVIGCGAAGLACLRYFAESPDLFSVVAYEQGSSIGGIWVYTDETGCDQHGHPVHGGIYDTLRINIPKEIMAYPDFPFTPSLPSFIGHEEVLKYLNDYADHFRLRKHVVLDTRVVSVEPEDNGEGSLNTKWRVSVQPSDNTSANTQQSIFDAVIVCNGNFSVPSMPRYKGLDTFRGRILHSKNYRRANAFSGQTVLTVGGSFSCWDITIDVAAKAKRVYMSHHHEQKYKTFPNNVVLVTGIRHFTNDGVVLSDDSALPIDVVIFNTGYCYSFPFLSPDCGVELSDGGTVKNLYKHTFNITRPSLAFVSVVIGYIPFLGISLQARLVKAVLEGRVCLPSEEDMRKDEEAEWRKRVDLHWPLKHRHKMAELQGSFYDDLCKMLTIEPLPAWIMKIYAYHFERFFEDIENCKRYNYHVLDSGDFTFSEQATYFKVNDNN